MWPFVIECARLPVSFTSSYFSCTKHLICALIFFRLLLWSVLTWSSIWTMSVNHSWLCSGSIMRRYAGSLLLQTSRNTGPRLFEASFECNTWKNQTPKWQSPEEYLKENSMYALLYTPRLFHPLPIASVSSCEAERGVWRIWRVRETLRDLWNEQLRDKRACPCSAALRQVCV